MLDVTIDHLYFEVVIDERNRGYRRIQSFWNDMNSIVKRMYVNGTEGSVGIYDLFLWFHDSKYTSNSKRLL